MFCVKLKLSRRKSRDPLSLVLVMEEVRVLVSSQCSLLPSIIIRLRSGAICNFLAVLSLKNIYMRRGKILLTMVPVSGPRLLGLIITKALGLTLGSELSEEMRHIWPNKEVRG